MFIINLLIKEHLVDRDVALGLLDELLAVHGHGSDSARFVKAPLTQDPPRNRIEICTFLIHKCTGLV